MCGGPGTGMVVGTSKQHGVLCCFYGCVCYNDMLFIILILCWASSLFSLGLYRTHAESCFRY